MIGYFGPIKFETSDKKILTFSGLSRTSSAKIAVHDIIGGKPTSEYTGADLDSITFTVSLNASQGVNPREVADKFLKMNRNGEAHALVIGKSGLGMDKWIITNVSQAWSLVFSKGQLYSCKVDLTLQEYISVKPVSKKRNSAKPGKSPTAGSSTKKKGLGKATVKVSSLNLRKGPGTKYPVIRAIQKNDTFFVYTIKNGWYDLGGGQWASNVGNKYMTFKAH